MNARENDATPDADVAKKKKTNFFAPEKLTDVVVHGKVHSHSQGVFLMPAGDLKVRQSRAWRNHSAWENNGPAHGPGG